MEAQIEGALLEANRNLSSLEARISGKDLIVFLGFTRSGKSTLINYLLGTVLIAQKRRTNSFKIEKIGECTGSPPIGQGVLSTTSIPGFYERDGLVLVDAPGFDDNRSEAQAIINAIYISQIRHSQTCKFVLVADINDIVHDNINNFVVAIKAVNALIGHIENFRNSTSLVLTKDNNNYTQQEIAEKMNNDIILNIELNIKEEDRELVRCFVQNERLISFFRMPTEEGIIRRDVDTNIFKAISESSPLTMNGYQVPIDVPNNIKVILFNICQQFINRIEFKNELDTVVTKFASFFDTDYVSPCTDEELQQATTDLSDLSSKLQYQDDTLNLQTLLDSITNLIELDTSADLYKTLKLFTMLDEVALINSNCKESLVRKYNKSLDEIQSKVVTLTAKIDAEQEERSSNIKTTIVAGSVSAIAAAAGAAAVVFGEVVAASGMVALASTGVGLVVIAGAAIAGGIIGLIQTRRQQQKTEARRRQGRPIG